MARQLTRIIAELTDAVRQLAAQRDEALAGRRELEGRVEELERKLAETEHALQISRMETDFLTVSHRLADDPDKLVSARRRVGRLISKIDRCVALLKEDADIS